MASSTTEEQESGDFTNGAESPVSRAEISVSRAEISSVERSVEGLSKEELISRRDKAIVTLSDYCGHDSDGGEPLRPLRVVVVGEHGAGKSSFINGVAAALSQVRWHEYAYTGNRGIGAPITIVNQRFEKCCNGQREPYKNVLLPTLIDVAGLSNEMDDKVEELLRLLFYGHIKEDQPLWAVYEFCKHNSVEKIREKYSQNYPDMRVDRVIFVASARASLPERLMTSVLNAARPSHHKIERREVPIWGVLTKKDKVDVSSTDYLKRKEKFMNILGLNQTRFLLCSNYCDDLDPYGDRVKELNPKLDVPIIEFMQRVCDRTLVVTKEEENLPGTGNASLRTSPEDVQNAANMKKQEVQKEKEAEAPVHGRPERQNGDTLYKDALLAALVGVAVMVTLYVVVPSGGQVDPTLSEACKTDAIKDAKYKTLLCQQQSSSFALFQQRVGQLVVAFLIAIVVFLYRHVSKRF